MEFMHHYILLKSVLKSSYVSAITRTCHLTLCLDVQICIWGVFQNINMILELKVKVKLRQTLKYDS